MVQDRCDYFHVLLQFGSIQHSLLFQWFCWTTLSAMCSCPKRLITKYSYDLVRQWPDRLQWTTALLKLIMVEKVPMYTCQVMMDMHNCNIYIVNQLKSDPHFWQCISSRGKIYANHCSVRNIFFICWESRKHRKIQVIFCFRKCLFSWNQDK